MLSVSFYGDGSRDRPSILICCPWTFFTRITRLGSLVVLLPRSLLFFFGRHELTSQKVTLLLGSLAASLLSQLLKLTVSRPRPVPEEMVVAMPTDYSFPCAHSAQVTAVFPGSAMIVAKDLGSPTFWLPWTGILGGAAVTGISRV
jgi:undecaprenyl-diphosphatase